MESRTTPIDLTPGPGDRRLEIGIIGAGIAGLGAAIALGQAGHDVEVCKVRVLRLHRSSARPEHSKSYALSFTTNIGKGIRTFPFHK